MKETTCITTLFLDIGGVLLTNGWDHDMRRRAAEKFGFDYQEMDERHRMTFDTYEMGKISLDTYLRRTVFYEPRPFTQEEFREFMFDQSEAFPEMIALATKLKARHGLRVATVSNEGRELTEFRVAKFQLWKLADVFISSSFVHVRKPDEEIYRMALDALQVRPEQVAYVEDRKLFVEVAQGLGIQGVHHHDLDATRAELEGLGLSVEAKQLTIE